MNEIPPTPPLSPQGGMICPNCGAPQNAGTAFCTQCGAALQIAKPSFATKALKWILTTLLSLIALGIGAFGACAGFIAMIGNSDSSGAYGSGATTAQFVGWGVAIVAAMALCGWLIGIVNKKL